MSRLFTYISKRLASRAPLPDNYLPLNLLPLSKDFAAHRAHNGIFIFLTRHQINPFAFANHSGIVMVIAVIPVSTGAL